MSENLGTLRYIRKFKTFMVNLTISGIVPLYCETLFKQTDEKKAAGSKDEYEVCLVIHYKNMPMQHSAIFHGCKYGNFLSKSFDFFHIFAQNIYCRYALEPPQ